MTKIFKYVPKLNKDVYIIVIISYKINYGCYTGNFGFKN